MGRSSRARKDLKSGTPNRRPIRGTGNQNHPLRISDPELWNSLKPTNNEVVFVFGFRDRAKLAAFQEFLCNNERNGGETWREYTRSRAKKDLLYYVRYDMKRSRVDAELRRLKRSVSRHGGSWTSFLVRVHDDNAEEEEEKEDCCVSFTAVYNADELE